MSSFKVQNSEFNYHQFVFCVLLTQDSSTSTWPSFSTSKASPLEILPSRLTSTSTTLSTTTRLYSGD